MHGTLFTSEKNIISSWSARSALRPALNLLSYWGCLQSETGSDPSEPATFIQRLLNVFQTRWVVVVQMSLVHWRLEHVGQSLYKRRWFTGVWNTLGSRCSNVAGSLAFETRWVVLYKRRWYGVWNTLGSRCTTSLFTCVWNTLGSLAQTSMVHWDAFPESTHNRLEMLRNNRTYLPNLGNTRRPGPCKKPFFFLCLTWSTYDIGVQRKI